MDYQKIFNRGNQYFDTYHIKDENDNYIGILEDHCRQVKGKYFVGWNFEGKFIPNSFQSGKTKSFDNEDDAINYVFNGEDN